MGGIIGGIVGGLGKKKAAKQARGDIQAGVTKLDPFAAPGAAATDALSGALGLNGSTAAGEGLSRFRDSLGFRDTLNQSLRGVASNAAAKGLLNSTGTGTRFQQSAGQLAKGTLNDFLGKLFGVQQSAQGAATNQANLLSGQPQSKGTVLSGVGSNLNRIFLGN